MCLRPSPPQPSTVLRDPGNYCFPVGESAHLQGKEITVSVHEHTLSYSSALHFAVGEISFWVMDSPNYYQKEKKRNLSPSSPGIGVPHSEWTPCFKLNIHMMVSACINRNILFTSHQVFSSKTITHFPNPRGQAQLDKSLPALALAVSIDSSIGAEGTGGFPRNTQEDRNAAAALYLARASGGWPREWVFSINDLAPYGTLKMFLFLTQDDMLEAGKI